MDEQESRGSTVLADTLLARNMPDCICVYRWKAYGMLHGVPLASSWVRMATRPDCRHHGIPRIP